jgi:hypothetical protein
VKCGILSALFIDYINVTNEDKSKSSEAKGFAGLSSMESGVDDLEATQHTHEPETHSRSSTEKPVDGKRSDQKCKATSKPTNKTTTTAQHVPASSSSRSSTFKWLLGIGIVIGVIWLANQGGESTPSKPSRPSESKPSIGTNHLLSAAEIRYCLAESIRIEAARNVMDKQSSSHIARFNRYVDDYNSRCSKYRYRAGALERARRDINPYRGQIRAEGRNRFL